MASSAAAGVSSGTSGYAHAPMQMMALGLVILAAHLGGKLCRRLRLSEVTGQLVGGALVGPYALHLSGILGPDQLAYDHALAAFQFFVFVFLSVVAFGIGEELHLSRVRQVGWTALGITGIQGFATWALITTGFLLWGGRSAVECMLIGSIGVASAPAVTFVLMNQLQIEGRLRQVVGSVVVLADVAEVILFSLLLQISVRAQHLAGGGEAGEGVLLPVVMEVVFAALLGLLIYVILRLLVGRHAAALHEEERAGESKPPAAPDRGVMADAAFLHRVLAEHPSPSAEILLIVIGAVSLCAGVAYLEDWPFLITAILGGFLVANLHSHAIFDSLKIDNITPVLNLGFFALIGASISFETLSGETAMLAGIYVGTRLVGKVAGTWLGARVMCEDRKVTAVLPMLLLPQAGVGAVEAVYASAVLGKPEIAAIILPAIVFFEVFGVYMVDRTLRRWRSWVADEEKAVRNARLRSGAGEAARRLIGLLSPERVIAGLAAETKRGVLEEMVDRARELSEQHIDRAQALQVLGEREQLAPTGYGHGIAVPHCRLMGLERAVLVFGRHPKGVVFGGVDNEPCDLIMLILSSARKPSEHLQLLAATAHILGDEEIRRRLRAAPDEAGMLAVLQEVAVAASELAAEAPPPETNGAGTA